MVRKIFSSIILIMVICSTCVYGTDIIAPEDTSNPSQEQNPSEDTSNSSQEQNPPSAEDETTSGDIENEDSNNTTGGNADSNTSTQPGKGGNTDSDNNSSGDGNNNDSNVGNNQTNSGNNEEVPKVETPQDTTQNNQGTTNNNIVIKSSEARLKELKVDLEGLTPDFNKNTTEYYLVVDLSVNKINVTASTVDNKAKWAIYGNRNLKEGENTITINVTAEDGAEKKYYIYVTKIDDVELANAELEALEVNGFNLYPTFKSNIYSYNLHINKDISDLDIMAKPQRENATVQIEGNTNLQEGENIIEIKVTAEDETTVRTYKINTFIDSDRVEIKEENKTPAIILIVVLGASIIGLGTFIVTKNRR